MLDEEEVDVAGPRSHGPPLRGVPSGQAARLVVQPLSPASARALASRSRFTVFWPTARVMNRFCLTGTSPATALLGLGDLLIDPAQRAAATRWEE